MEFCQSQPKAVVSLSILQFAGNLRQPAAIPKYRVRQPICWDLGGCLNRQDDEITEGRSVESEDLILEVRSSGIDAVRVWPELPPGAGADQSAPNEDE